MDEVQTLRRIVTATDLETAKSMAEATLGQGCTDPPEIGGRNGFPEIGGSGFRFIYWPLTCKGEGGSKKRDMAAILEVNVIRFLWCSFFGLQKNGFWKLGTLTGG